LDAGGENGDESGVRRSGGPVPLRKVTLEAEDGAPTYPRVETSELLKRPNFVGNLAVKFLKEHQVFPIKITDDNLSVAVADPWDNRTLDALRLATGYRLKVFQGDAKDILEAIERFYGAGATTMEKIIDDMKEEWVTLDSEEKEDIDHLRYMASEAPIIKLVNLFITKAVETRASDIHIEPFEDRLYVRYRVDGVLQDVETPPRRLQAAIISRVKLMANLNIAERRLPQDGRLRLRVSGREVDIRVSTVPTLYGESVVMRLLDRGSIMLSLEELGFPGRDLEAFKSIISKPYGMVLVTGPTGSGKTTTLYAALQKISTPEKKVITVEDPVEYQLVGVNQIQVKPQIGLTFANGLRSIVRQDPDIIMVGEIRDVETAEIAIESALTGHLVFSTLHTNDAAGAITRLLDMGVEHYLVASSLEGILAQRLVRLLCPECREPYSPSPGVLREMGIGARGDGLTLYRPKGCSRCGQTGYRGRIGIFELLDITDQMRESILDKTGANVIRERGIDQGMRLLREDGWEKVQKGLTSVEEVLRVTMETK
jgi:general secretion pathway protein E